MKSLSYAFWSEHNSTGRGSTENLFNPRQSKIVCHEYQKTNCFIYVLWYFSPEKSTTTSYRHLIEQKKHRNRVVLLCRRRKHHDNEKSWAMMKMTWLGRYFVLIRWGENERKFVGFAAERARGRWKRSKSRQSHCQSIESNYRIIINWKSSTWSWPGHIHIHFHI